MSFGKFSFMFDGTWEAWGFDGMYLIEVCDDGWFIASYTDSETQEKYTAKTSYQTFKDARLWCINHEDKLTEERKAVRS